MSRRWSLLRRWAFWLPLGIVGVACGPWYALVPRAQHEDVARYGGFAFRAVSLLHFAWHWYLAAGLVVTLFAVIGLAKLLVRCWRGGEVDGRLVAFGRVPDGGGGVSEFRRGGGESAGDDDGAAVPGAIGVGWRGMVCGAGPAKVGRGVCGGCCGAGGGVNLRALPPVSRPGFSAAADVLTARGAGVFLVSSDAGGEGMLIAEVAMRERRPASTVLRASKTLYSANWNGGDYRPRFRTTAEVAAFLDRERVRAVVVDLSTRSDAEDRLLLVEALDGDRRYDRLAESGRSGGRDLAIYRIRQ